MVPDPSNATAAPVENGGVVWKVGGTAAGFGSAIPTSALTDIADHIWYMDEGGESIIGDSVGNEDGSLSGGFWATDNGGTGDVVVRQDTDGDIISIGTGVFDTQTAFTVCAWGYWTGVLSNGDYLFQENTTDVLLQVTSTGVAEAWVGGDVNQDLYTLSEGWYMGAVTYADGTATAYLYELGNGQVVKSSWPATDPAWDGEFAFGNRPGGDRTWADDIDYGIVAYQEATETEINDHYTNTVGLYGGGSGN